MPLGPILGAVGAIGSSLISNVGAKQRQNLANRQNVEFWNMQNKYNTPKAQMERLKEAGLNPNLIYGSGQTNTGVAGSIAASKPAPYNIQNPVPAAIAAGMYTPQKAYVEAKTVSTIKESGIKGVELDLAKGNLKNNLELNRIATENAAEALYQQKIKSNIASETERAIINQQIEKLANQKIINKNLNLDQEVKKLQARNAERGVMTNYTFLERLLALFLQKSGIDIDFKSGGN